MNERPLCCLIKPLIIPPRDEEEVAAPAFFVVVDDAEEFSEEGEGAALARIDTDEREHVELCAFRCRFSAVEVFQAAGGGFFFVYRK